MNNVQSLSLATDPVLYLGLLVMAMLLCSMPLTFRYVAHHPDAAVEMFTPVGESLLQASS